jgi:hypothetical protein
MGTSARMAGGSLADECCPEELARLGGFPRRRPTGAGAPRTCGDFIQRCIGRRGRRPASIMGEMDDPFVKLLDGEIARIKRSTKMVPKGAVLTRNGRDRQRHESTITTREPRPSPDLSHQVVCCDFSVGVDRCGRFGLHHLAPDLSRSSAMIVTSAHLNPFLQSRGVTNTAWPVRSASPPASESQRRLFTHHAALEWRT